jgi:hypothetical protein
MSCLLAYLVVGMRQLIFMRVRLILSMNAFVTLDGGQLPFRLSRNRSRKGNFIRIFAIILQLDEIRGNMSYQQMLTSDCESFCC